MFDHRRDANTTMNERTRFLCFGSGAARILVLSPPVADQAPILLHQLDVARRQPGSDVDFAVGYALVDLQLGDGPPVDKHKNQTAAAFDAERVERNTSVIAEVNERAVTFVSRRVRIKCDHVLLGNARSTFDGYVLAGKFRRHTGVEDAGIAGVGFDVQPKQAMSVFGDNRRQGDEHAEYAREQTFHGRLIKGLTGFATFAD